MDGKEEDLDEKFLQHTEENAVEYLSILFPRPRIPRKQILENLQKFYVSGGYAFPMHHGLLSHIRDVGVDWILYLLWISKQQINQLRIDYRKLGLNRESFNQKLRELDGEVNTNNSNGL